MASGIVPDQGHPLDAPVTCGHRSGPTLDRFGFQRAWLMAAVSVVAVGLASTVHGRELTVPDITVPASHEQHIGKVVFLELVTPDLEGAKQFYGQLFGWQFSDSSAGSVRYADATLDGHPVAGLIYRPLPAQPRRHPSWLSFFSVDNVDVSAKEAVARGGRILFAPHNTLGRGREAVLADPHGAVFAVVKSTSGDPPDELADPGDWIWSTLLTHDPDHDAGFYQSMFDYDVFEIPEGDQGSEHLILSTNDLARASVNSISAGAKDIKPHWLNFIRVVDTSTTINRVVALGGKLLVPERLDRHGGRIAVVADPTGAPFGLFEWGPDRSQETSR